MSNLNVRASLKQILGSLEKDFESFPWGDATIYSQWLAQTYYFVRHSTRLLAASAARFEEDKFSLHTRFAQHMREESGHQFLALNDLKVLGCDIKDFEEFPMTAAFYETQYFKIDYQSPISLFGYILVLEDLACTAGKIAYRQALKAHGEKAVSFLKLHAEEDEGHVDEAYKKIEALSDEEKRIILKNALQSAHIYSHLLREVKEINEQDLGFTKGYQVAKPTDGPLVH